MNLLKERISDLFVTRFLRLGKNAEIKVTNANGTENTVDLNELVTKLDNAGAVETVTATNVITAAESGKTFFLSAAAGFASTLPAPAAGLRYKFVVATSPTSNGYTIATNGSANIIKGGVNELEVDTGDDGPYSAVGDLITLVANVAVVGDWLEVISDGTSWFLTGQTNADGGVTIGST